ncbi:MAG: sugar phosphate isomerase/epimerase [Acidobacteriota bacterium]|nr:sugar phosphate isomerase/epimerase [Acidobacteriota bacterium]
MNTTRRTFLATAACATAALAARRIARAQAKSPFKISVITGEISEDFDHACFVASKDFGMQWVELRTMWGKNIADLGADDMARVQSTLAKYNLRVTDLASPLFKVDWPGAPTSKYSARHDNFAANDDFKKQDDVLGTCIEHAKQLKTDKIRIFDFLRLDDVAPYRDAIHDKLRTACEIAKKQGIMLVIENEQSCNTSTAPEAARTLAAVPPLMLNWDPANAVFAGEADAFPKGWDLLPKDRIQHCHCKNTVLNDAGKPAWSPVDIGLVNWPAQYRALKSIGYRNAVSLETHWAGGGSPEASSRISWAGMKKSLQDSQAL